jgi:nucleotide-binding universal stress UspA family protein
MHAALDAQSAVTGGGAPVVLCATDGRTRHQDVVELAAVLAGDLAATVLVLHVRRTSPLAGVDLAVAGLAAVWAKQLQQESLTSAAEILRRHGVPGAFLATGASPVPELLQLARRTSARAVVVSGCPRRGSRTWMHACPVRALQRRAPCFVVTAG